MKRLKCMVFPFYKKNLRWPHLISLEIRIFANEDPWSGIWWGTEAIGIHISEQKHNGYICSMGWWKRVWGNKTGQKITHAGVSKPQE